MTLGALAKVCAKEDGKFLTSRLDFWHPVTVLHFAAAGRLPPAVFLTSCG